MFYYIIAKNRKVLLFAVIIIAVIAGLNFKKEVSSYEEASAAYADLEEKFVAAPSQETATDKTSKEVQYTAEPVQTVTDEEDIIPELTEVPELDVDFDALYDINRDIIAWIYIPAAKISYPVVQGKGDEYLNIDFNGKKNKAGCVYLNSQNTADFSDNNSFIHAHNMADGSMFGKLDETFLWNDASGRNIYIFLADGTVYGYEVTYVYTVSDDSDVFRFTESDTAYGAYLDEVKELSGSEETADISEKMITLVTCYGKAHSGEKLCVNAVMTGMASH